MSRPQDTADDDLEWEEWDASKISFVNHMIAGSFAGLAEHVSIFPVDTVKTHLQCERCGSMSPLKTFNCAKRIVDREGIMRLWRGVSATFAGCIPAHAAYFSIFESMKILSGANKEGHHPLQAALCGASAALAHDMCMTPFDTVKQRMQLGYYRSLYHCSKVVIRTEGIAALYVSLPATLMMNLPYGMVMVAANESLKKVINPDGSYSPTSSMFAGGLAGGLAAALTTPLDIIKTRLQTQDLLPVSIDSVDGDKNGRGAFKIGSEPQRGSYRPAADLSVRYYSGASGSSVDKSRHALRYLYQSTLQTARAIFLEAGFTGYFRGVLPRVLTHAPAVGISWTAYESAKAFLTDLDW